MRIVLTSSEVAPFSKSGGMGDVAGALPRALAARGHTVVTVSPLYASVDRERFGLEDTGLTVGIHGANAVHQAHFWRTELDGVVHLFVENPMFDRAGLYGDEHGAYGDNHLRFSVLSRAAIEAARRVPVLEGEPLGEEVLFHCNDWQTALVPIYLAAHYRPLGLFAHAATVLTLHNVAHQGRLPARFFDDLELAPRWFAPTGLEWFGDLGLLKGGILWADMLSAVSPTYARELLQAGGAHGLEGPLRIRRGSLRGVLNGIDPAVWSPAVDPLLPATYDADALAGKAACKAALQQELGLAVDPSVPLVGTVGRLDPQKGIELIVESVPWLVQEMGAQVVVLGSAAEAHKRYEHQLAQLQRRFSGRVVAWLGFSERVAHLIEAGSDLFVMPSRFEPCGLNQLYSLAYGTPPVVRATGGLADTVRTFDPKADTGNGWAFDDYSGGAFREALYWALSTWRRDPEAFTRLVRRGMREQHAWTDRVGEYEALYAEALAKRA